jgi:glucose/arabinose dehydrogenase
MDPVIRARRPRGRTCAALLALGVLLAGCADTAGTGIVAPSSSSAAPTPQPGSTTARPTPTSSSATPVRGTVTGLATPEVLAEGLDVPWGLAFLPDGSALVAERRSGDVARVGANGSTSSAGQVPGVADQGEGGLLGLAVTDDGATVLAYLTSVQGDNRVVSLPYVDGRLGEPTVLLDGIPSGAIHNGGRIVIGPDDNLWIGTGDSGDRPRAQDLGTRAGKILRIGLDGSIPADNPFPGSPVWSYGHRNVQGLAFDSRGRLWATEFGQNTFDELNLVTKGGNFGWPVVEGRGGNPDYIDPVVTWRTEDASPSGLAIVNDVAYVAALRGRRVWQVPLDGSTAGDPVATLDGALGRIRTVQLAPDGTLWLTTSNRDGRGDPVDGDDRVVRVRIDG